MSQEDVAENINALKRAGWSIDATEYAGLSGDRVWVISGHNGENLIRAIGATQVKAWRRAVEQAREVGMFGRPWRPSRVPTG